MNQINKILYNLAQSSIQIGEIRAYSGSIIPKKWKACDGSVISRTTYDELFNVLGTMWGGGDGATTFALPDMKGRIPIGAGESSASGHTAHTLGQMAGEESHTITSGENARHAHNTGHGYNSCDGVETLRAIPNGGAWGGGISNQTSGSGSSGAHNTMQPYSVCNYIIYVGVEVT